MALSILGYALSFLILKWLTETYLKNSEVNKLDEGKEEEKKVEAKESKDPKEENKN